MTARMCPACARRWGMLIDDACPICSGLGVLQLGRGATGKYGPEAVSVAVEYALEGQARRALASNPQDTGNARAALTDGVAQLRARGMISRNAEGGPLNRRVPTTVPKIRSTAARITPGYQDQDGQACETRTLEWPPNDRPMAAGGIPGFSLGFFTCNLARAADPLDPLNPKHTVQALTGARWTASKRAEMLAQAAIPLFDPLERTNR